MNCPCCIDVIGAAPAGAPALLPIPAAAAALNRPVGRAVVCTNAEPSPVQLTGCNNEPPWVPTGTLVNPVAAFVPFPLLASVLACVLDLAASGGVVRVGTVTDILDESTEDTLRSLQCRGSRRWRRTATATSA